MPKAKRKACSSPSACASGCGDGPSPKKLFQASEAPCSNITESTSGVHDCSGGNEPTSERRSSNVERASHPSGQQKDSVSDPDLICRAIALNKGHAAALAKMRRAFAQKYCGVTLYADDMKGTPSAFWIKRYPEDDPMHYELTTSEELVIPEKMTKKWQLPFPSKTDERQLCLSYMRHIFQLLADLMLYDHRTASWMCVEELEYANKADDDDDDDYDDDDDDLDNDDDKPNDPHGLIPGQKAGDQGTSKKQKQDESYAVVSTLVKYGFLSFDVKARLVSALESQMRNSCGRDAVCMLIRLACAVAFGPDFETRPDGVFIYQVGTSNYPFEGFPIVSKKHMTESNMSENVTSPEHDVPVAPSLEIAGFISPKTAGNVHCNSKCCSKSHGCKNLGCKSPDIQSSAGVSQSSHSSNASTSSFGKGYIYSDLIVACPSGDSAKFMLVVEVKSSSGRTQELGQLLRQVAGTLVGQKQVFGLVISHSKATLLRACRDDAECAIIRSIKEYSLLRSIKSAPYFQSEKWFDLFADIIKVVDAAKENILLE